jgi:hypothetical protein
MFQILGSIFKYSIITLVILIASHLITLEGETISNHVGSALKSLALDPVQVPRMNQITTGASDAAQEASQSFRRAWKQVPDLGVKSPSAPSNNARTARANPHAEKHSVESRKDLQEMLQEIRSNQVSSRVTR